MRGQRGQTAAEYLGALLLVAAIVAALVAAGVPGRIADEIDSIVCQLAGRDCHVAATGAAPGDHDGDGIPDDDERAAGTNPFNATAMATVSRTAKRSSSGPTPPPRTPTATACPTGARRLRRQAGPDLAPTPTATA